VRPAAAAKGVELSCALDPRAESVRGDTQRLQQVIWNLLANAVKFTPAGGRVNVKVERLLRHVRIEVSDTGQGIAPDFLPFVFDRFRQADGSTTRRHGGLGLGLSLVRHLVEAHGGAVHAYSAGEGQGATFTVDLPLPAEASLPLNSEGEPLLTAAPDDAARSESVIESDLPPALVGVRVLLVDDDADALELLALLLRGHGAEIVHAGSSEAALAALTSSRADVLVSDIGMPGEDGYALMRRVRSLSPERGGQTPAIALTAYASADDRLQALRAGFQWHLPKPVDAPQLVKVIATLAAPKHGAA
jgi:CheY-like chemotaxis protein